MDAELVSAQPARVTTSILGSPLVVGNRGAHRDRSRGDPESEPGVHTDALAVSARG
jgi:hypothetical protein